MTSPLVRQPACPNRSTRRQAAFAAKLMHTYIESLSVGDARDVIDWLVKETTE